MEAVQAMPSRAENAGRHSENQETAQTVTNQGRRSFNRTDESSSRICSQYDQGWGRSAAVVTRATLISSSARLFGAVVFTSAFHHDFHWGRGGLLGL